MKTKLKFILSFLFALVFFSSIKAQEPSPIAYKCVGGVYYTYDDFLKNNITDFGVLITNMIGPRSVNDGYDKVREITFSDGSKNYIFKFKEGKIWGFRSTAGSTYRVNKEDNAAYNLISDGTYYLWTDHTTHLTRDENGKINWFQMDYNVNDLYERFSKHLFISAGANGELLNCNTKNLRELFKDEPEILSDLKANPIKEDDRNKIGLCTENVKKWVAMYNAKHK
jgi:hypothetical protein